MRRANKDLQANAAAYAAATTQITNNTVALAANKAALIALGPALAGTGAKIAAVLAGITAGIAGVAKSTAAFGSLLLTVGSKVLFVGSLFTLLGGAFANAIGKGEEFNAFVSDLGATLKTFFSNTEAIKAKKVFKGVTVGALTELEKTDAALRNTDSFTFKKKFLFFEVEVTKTKEDLVNEINSIISDVTTQKTFTEALTGRGAAIGGAIGAVLPTLLSFIPGIGPAAAILGNTFARGFTLAAGIAIGAWIDSTLFSGELDPNSDVAKRLRGQFANALSGFDVNIQNTILSGLAELENRYAKAAITDPRARIALRVQQELLLASGEYLSNIEVVSQLMQAIGQTSDVVAKNFKTVDGLSIKGFAEIEQAVSKFNEGVKVSFINIDSLRKTLEAPIKISVLDESVPNVSNEFGDTYDVYKIVEVSIARITEETLAAAEATNSLSRNIALVDFTQSNLAEAIRSGTVSLEQYEQGIGSVRAAQAASSQEYFNALAKIEAVQLEILTLQTDEERQAARGVIQGLKNRLESSIINLLVQQQTTRELEKQKDVLESQIKISDFLKSFVKDNKSDLRLELDFSTAGALDPLSKLITELEYLGGFVQQIGDDAAKIFKDNRNALRGLALDAGVTARILATPAEDIGTLVRSLSKELGGFTFENIDGQLKITQQEISAAGVVVRRAATAVVQLQQDGVAAIVSINEQAIEAIQEVVRSAIDELPSFINSALQSYQAAIAKTENDIKELTTKEPILKLQFDIDRRNLNQQLAEIRSDARITRFESDIELIEARKDLKEISPLQAAKQIAALEKNIIQERQTALTKAFEVELDNIDNRKSIIRAESEARKDAIRRETQAQIAKIDQDVAYVSTLVQAYDTFIRDTDAVNNKLVRDFVAAGNAVADNFATTFENGATVFATAVQQATLGQFTQAGQVGTAPAAVGTTAFSTTLVDTVSDFIIAAGSTISKLIEGENVKTAVEEAATNRALELIGLEQDAATARYVAEYAALLRAAALGDKVAQKRLQDIANETAQKSKTQQMIEELFTSIQSNIENTLTALNDFIFYGEGNFRDIIGNLFKSVQQDFFKTTIAKPLSSAITSSLFGALGIEVPAGGIEDAKVRNGALLVEIVDGPSKLFENVFKKDGEGGMLSGLFDNVSTFFSGLFGKNGVVANLFTGLFGSGGLFSSIFTGFGSIFGGLFGGVGSIFGSIFKGIFGLFGMAQGGMVHMASGGQLRDRVPALLEPGEFVIRKPMAREIGTPALQALNATGKVPASAPVINFKNEGTPKSVQSEQPRFDGEKYVIDIITRDLANNGPIRRTLRSGNL